jgi:hypothetical protein
VGSITRRCRRRQWWPPAPKPAKASKAKPAVVDIEPVPDVEKVTTDDGDIFG